MTHDEIADLLGAYVLDALSFDEREAVDGHLDTCSICTAEVADLLTVHDRLALLAVERDPPPDLRIRLMAMVEQDRAQWAREQTAASTASSPTVGRVPSWWDRTRQQLGRVPALAYGAGGALLVAAAILIAVVLTRSGVTTHTYPGGAVAQVVAGIDLRGVTAQVVVRSDHTTEVRCLNLPVLPSALAYELWFIPAGGTPIPVDGFTATPQHTWDKRYPRDAAGIQTVALTIERAPGHWPAPSKNLAIAVSLKS